MQFVVIFVIFTVLAIVINSIRSESHQGSINNQIESMGGKVISIERRSFFTGLGPFMVVGKGRVIYRIEYVINDEVKEGWVRFGGLLGPDWRL